MGLLYYVVWELSGGAIFGVVDAGPPMHLNISGGKFRENTYPNILKYSEINSRLSVGESILLIHAQRICPLYVYGVVIVSRNLERTNENDGFKITALEYFVRDVTGFITMVRDPNISRDSQNQFECIALH